MTVFTEEAEVVTVIEEIPTVTCARPGCGRQFPSKRARHIKAFCSQRCRQRDYWDSGRGRAARKAHHKLTPGPLLPGNRPLGKVAPRKPAANGPREPLVNTHVAGSVARALLYGDQTRTASKDHSSAPMSRDR